jgi:alpha-glucosidase
MRRLLQTLFLCLTFVTIAARAEPVARQMSPAGTLAVSITIDNDGRAAYAVTRAGRVVIAPSRLGFILADAPKLERNFRMESAVKRSVDESWDQPWGEP